MSESRRFLRYELTGLSMILNSILVLVYFFDIFELIDKIETNNISMYLIFSIIFVISLLLGWLAFQLFEDFRTPHNKTKSLKLIKRSYPKLEDGRCLAIIDFLLKDDMYIKYPGLAETLRGYWDIYYSRRIIGIGTPIVGILTYILVIINLYNINDIISYVEYLLNEMLLTWPEFDKDFLFSILKNNIYSILVIALNIIYLFIWHRSSRVFKEVEFQELLLIKDNEYMLTYLNHILKELEEQDIVRVWSQSSDRTKKRLR